MLKYIIAYVEVRSSSDNRSAFFSKALESLGAQVRSTFTDDVTHVVFKEGSKRTWNKAIKRNIPLVSASWLDSCRLNHKLMPEKDFPVMLPEVVSSPLPKFNQRPRWKKMKSMQPCDFNEEMARSAERAEKRRKRELMTNRFRLKDDSTPTSSSPGPILALDTQARSPYAFPNLSSLCSPVPDTPSSLKERLEKMLRNQEEVLEMDPETNTCTPKQPLEKPLQRRLFGSDLISSSSDDDVVTSRIVQGVIKSLENDSPKCSISCEPNKEHAFSSPERCNSLFNKNLESSLRKKSLSLKSPFRQSKSHAENKLSHVSVNDATSEQSTKKTLKPLSPQDLNAGSLPVSPSHSYNVKVYNTSSLKGFQLNPSVGSLTTLFGNGITDQHSLCQTDLVQENKSEVESIIMHSKPSKPSSITHKESHDAEMAKNMNMEDGPLRPKLTRKKKLFSGQQSSAFIFNASKQYNEEDLSNRPLSSRRKMDDSLESARADASFLFSVGCSENSSQNNTNNKKTSILQISSKNTKHKVRKDVNLSDEILSQESSCEMIPSSCTQEDSSKIFLESSMSVMYPSDASHVNLQSGRRRSTRLSINEFSLKNSHPKKIDNFKKKILNKEVQAVANISINNSTDKVKNQSVIKRKRSLSSSSGRQSTVKNKKQKKSDSGGNSNHKLNCSSAADVEEGTSAKLRHARSLVIAKQDLICQKDKYSLVMTSLHRDEQDVVCSVVKKFGIFQMTNHVQPCTTHVVCGDARRTLNILRAIARGCWVLKKSWVFESLEAGCWLLEENYEMEMEFPAARKSRLEREKVGHGYKPNLLSKVGPICVFNDCTPPREELVHLINLCCGHVTGSQTRASVFIGNSHDPKRLVIRPAWILDCIMSLETLNPLDYIVPAPVSQREKSPEF